MCDDRGVLVQDLILVGRGSPGCLAAPRTEEVLRSIGNAVQRTEPFALGKQGIELVGAFECACFAVVSNEVKLWVETFESAEKQLR